jgi:hypothetical protein
MKQVRPDDGDDRRQFAASSFFLVLVSVSGFSPL